ncbi:hypothetical protein NIES4074_36350 [Cylindrospermum sp. NIES-4074]|nr:hypothetical protein NIES4074_36350 [Cylindrospermum sp. NIES-4074]
MPKPLGYFVDVTPNHPDYMPLVELRTLYGDYLSGFKESQLNLLLTYCALTNTQVVMEPNEEFEYYAESLYEVLPQDEHTAEAIDQLSRISHATRFDLIPFLHQLIKELNNDYQLLPNSKAS